MTEDEFTNLMGRMEEAYPSQPKYQNTQKAIFWTALQDQTYKELVYAFIEHCKVDEWKPQVPVHLLKHLTNKSIQLRETFMLFFQHKEMKDKLAVSVINKMGSDRLRKSTEKQFESLLEEFCQLYGKAKNKSICEALPNNIKNKLMGVIK